MAEDHRKHEIRVRLSEQEHQQVRRAAATLNLPMALWARQLILAAAARVQETELAEALNAYTDPGHPDYDPEFDAKIRKLRPDWFDAPDASRN